MIRRRIDESGTKEPIIQRQGDDRLIVQLPGVDNPEEVKKLIGRTAKMSFRLVDHNVPPTLTVSSLPPPLGSEYLAEAREDSKNSIPCC